MLARPAAVKLIRPDKPISVEVADRFAFEAQAAARLRSIHSVEVYDFGVTRDGAFFLVMELLEGMDLETVVRKFGPPPPARAVHVLLQVCEVLSEAHEAGLLHRDIKPANIFLTTRSSSLDLAKLLDFGLVRTIGCDREQPATPRKLAGTPAYLPPEVVTADCYGECHVDGRADLYAVAAVAYYILSGELLFDRDTAEDMAVAHVVEEVIPLGQQVTVPSDLEDAVMKALAKDPDSRQPSVAAFAEELREVSVPSWSAADARRWWQRYGEAATKPS